MARPARRKAKTGGALDPATGALTLDDGATFGPQHTRSDFLATPRGRAAGDLIVNEPWHSWRLVERIGGLEFSLAVFFEGERLRMLMLVLRDSRYGASSDDWSEEKEKARDAAHQRWLAVQLPGSRADAGGQRKLPWGTVWAGYDPRSDGSSIMVRYGND